MSDETLRFVVLPGDGIGGEVTAAAVRVADTQAQRHGLRLDVREFPIGGKAIERHGEPLPEHVLAECRDAGVILLGAVGDSRYDQSPPEKRPEQGILRLRKELNLFANLRPVRTFKALLDASTLKREIIEGVDILFVRELTGGIYFGEPRGEETRGDVRVAFDTEVYHDYEIERIATVAFDAARDRSGRVSSVDKSNVLASSRLWRTVVEEVATGYSDVDLQHVLVDNCAMQLVRDPRQFDVLLTSNMFGDILSDEAAMLTGSLGMLPSASLGPLSNGPQTGLYEPVHGSAPDIAGQGKANPLAAILSCALLFRFSFGLSDVATEIGAAVEQVLLEGHRTADIAASTVTPLSTTEMADRVISALG